jgi:hypothetical protein
MSGERLRILVSGMIAAVPHHGGATWAVLQYVLGFRALGHDTVFVEQVEPAALRPEGSALEESDNARYMRSVANRFDFGDRWALLEQGSGRTAGLSYDSLRDIAREADIVINISGILTDEALMGAARTKVYLDLDPAFNQLWHAQGIDMHFSGHDRFVTVGQSIGTPHCTVPTSGIDWIPTVPPVVLDHWPVAPGGERFTTIGNWRGYGSVEHDGVQYGQKAHSMRDLMTVAARAKAPFLLALDIHPGETPDLEALDRNGWQIVDPATVSADPDAYRDFIAGSLAEFGVAKSGYVLSRCGWFSDRSACYLASGKPVVAQDTGFGRYLPTGAGLLSFAGEAEAVAAVDEVCADVPRHAAAAREIAQEHLDSRLVLTRLIERIGTAR